MSTPYEEFCHAFVKEVPSAQNLGERYYAVGEDLKEYSSGEKRKPYAKGLPLGREKKENGEITFKPSSALLQLLAQSSERKAVLSDEKVEWLFICGRDILPDKYSTVCADGLVLVQNSRDENLGLGKLSPGEKGMMLLNVHDLGQYLRGESKQKQYSTRDKKKRRG